MLKEIFKNYLNILKNLIYKLFKIRIMNENIYQLVLMILSNHLVQIIILLFMGSILILTISHCLFDKYEQKRDIKKLDYVYRNLFIGSEIITYFVIIFFFYFRDIIPTILNAIFILFSSTIVFTLQLYFKEVHKYQQIVKNNEEKKIKDKKILETINELITTDLLMMEQILQFYVKYLEPDKEKEFLFYNVPNFNEKIYELAIRNGANKIIYNLTSIKNEINVFNLSLERLKELINEDKNKKILYRGSPLRIEIKEKKDDLFMNAVLKFIMVHFTRLDEFHEPTWPIVHKNLREAENIGDFMRIMNNNDIYLKIVNYDTVKNKDKHINI